MINAKELFLNGEFILAERGVISVRTHAFAYGTGVFEGIRGYWNEEEQQMYLFRLREHYKRLLASSKTLQIHVPYTVDELIAISQELVRRNGQREDIYLRPVAYLSDEIFTVRLHELTAHLLITSEPMGSYIATSGLRCGAPGGAATITRCHLAPRPAAGMSMPPSRSPKRCKMASMRLSCSHTTVMFPKAARKISSCSPMASL